MSDLEISVIIPVKNERSTIGPCISALAQQDISPDRLEVIVVDGGSSDATPETARAALAEGKFGRGSVIRSARGTRPANLNAGLAVATGDIVCRVDARSRLPASYLQRCAEMLNTHSDVVVVGGRQRAVAARQTWAALSIARALNNRWATGGSPYRWRKTSGASDTVYLGAFRRTDLLAAGGWDEALPVNEDFDLNSRLGRAGIVWFDPNLTVAYEARSELGDLLRQYLGFGRSKAAYWWRRGRVPEPRQLVLLLGTPIAVAGLFIALKAAPLTASVLSIALATTVDIGGSSCRSATLRVRAGSVIAMGLMAGGWITGVYVGLAAQAAARVFCRVPAPRSADSSMTAPRA